MKRAKQRVMTGARFGLAVVGAVALVALSARAEAPSHVGTSGGAPAEPGKAASYRLVDIDAIKGLLRESRGHVVVVHFWASWCGPCLEELPLIDKFAHDMKPRGLEVLSLSLDNPSREGVAARVGALLRKSAPNLTPNIAQFEDADQLIAAIDPRWGGAIPALFAFDHLGQLRGNLIGESSRPELDHLVGALLKAAATDGAAAHVAPPKHGSN